MAHPAITRQPAELREGDRLSSREFLRRWEAMPDLKHAELIDGVVFCKASPVSRTHSSVHYEMSGWLWSYESLTPGCEGGLDGTWVMGDQDTPQPDLALRIIPDYGGQSTNAGDYNEGAPELIVEVSGSSLSRDLGAKLELYRRAGVREYLTVLLKPQQVIWRQLVRGRYREIAPAEDGLLHSHAFPGLWLDAESVWSKEKPIRKAVELGVNSAEHAAFVKKLAAAHRPK